MEENKSLVDDRYQAALEEIVRRERRSEYSSIYAAPSEFAAVARSALGEGCSDRGQPCMKCIPGNNVIVRYHPRRSYCDPHSRFTFSSREDEHLHYTCRNCGYDWTGDVADAE